MARRGSNTFLLHHSPWTNTSAKLTAARVKMITNAAPPALLRCCRCCFCGCRCCFRCRFLPMGSRLFPILFAQKLAYLQKKNEHNQKQIKKKTRKQICSKHFQQIRSIPENIPKKQNEEEPSGERKAPLAGCRTAPAKIIPQHTKFYKIFRILLYFDRANIFLSSSVC